MAVGVVVLAGACSTSNPTSAGSATPAGQTGAAPGASAAGPAASPLATEVNPPGDIPDNQAYVSFQVPGSTATVKVPEGWSRSTAGSSTTFADKLNRITVSAAPAASAPTTAAVQSRAAAQLGSAVSKYAAGNVSTVQRAGQPVILFTYAGDSAPDPVTSKVVRDAFEQYTYWRAGTEVVLTLVGPSNADNVDPWRIVSDSVNFA